MQPNFFVTCLHLEAGLNSLDAVGQASALEFVNQPARARGVVRSDRGAAQLAPARAKSEVSDVGGGDCTRFCRWGDLTRQAWLSHLPPCFDYRRGGRHSPVRRLSELPADDVAVTLVTMPARA